MRLPLGIRSSLTTCKTKQGRTGYLYIVVLEILPHHHHTRPETSDIFSAPIAAGRPLLPIPRSIGLVRYGIWRPAWWPSLISSSTSSNGALFIAVGSNPFRALTDVYS